MKITKKDLAAALAVPWASCTCLIAQAISRIDGSPVKKADEGNQNETQMWTEKGSLYLLQSDAVALQKFFDGAVFDLETALCVEGSGNGEEGESNLFLLEKVLPLEVGIQKLIPR